MRDQKKRVWIAGLVALAVFAVLLRLASQPSSEMGTPSPSPSGAALPTVKKTPIPRGSAMPASYSEALVQYANRRIQFDSYCQAQPSSVSLKNGLSVMLDNRSGDARTFAVGGVFFTLPGYGWRIFTPTAKVLPATLRIDCGSARNVGTIILQ